MEIKVTVKADSELLAAIDNLTAVLIEILTNEATPETPKKTIKKADKPTITLETVREKLAALSQGGKQKEVKALITGFGVAKLTDIPEGKYPEVMEKAAELEAES